MKQMAHMVANTYAESLWWWHFRAGYSLPLLAHRGILVPVFIITVPHDVDLISTTFKGSPSLMNILKQFFFF